MTKDTEYLCIKGDYASILLVADAKEEYDALGKRNDATSIREYRTLTRYFERYVQHGPTALDDTAFKKQRRVTSGKLQEMVYEFKAYQFRIYGVVGTYLDKRCFIGTACDPSKKQNKANAALLEKAVKVWGECKDDL